MTELELLFFERSVYCTISLLSDPFQRWNSTRYKNYKDFCCRTKKDRKRESSLKDHRQDLPKTGWSSFDHLFSISLVHSRQTEIFRRMQPLLKPGRKGCTDIRAAHVLISLCDTVLINAAKAESHIFLQRPPGNLWSQHYYIPFLATQL